MLNENIKNLRKSFSLSQVELAAKLGVTKQCICNRENDKLVGLYAYKACKIF